MSTCTACTCMLKANNIPEVAVEFEHYCTYVALHTYVTMYVHIASTEHRYGSTGFIHIIADHAFLYSHQVYVFKVNNKCVHVTTKH